MTWRVLFFLLKIGVIGALAVFFALEPGRVSIDWQGWAIDMPVGIFALVLILAVLLFVYAERIRQILFRFPGRWRAHRTAIREMKGYRSLTLGMVAVAAPTTPYARTILKAHWHGTTPPLGQAIGRRFAAGLDLGRLLMLVGRPPASWVGGGGRHVDGPQPLGRRKRFEAPPNYIDRPISIH